MLKNEVVDEDGIYDELVMQGGGDESAVGLPLRAENLENYVVSERWFTHHDVIHDGEPPLPLVSGHHDVVPDAGKRPGQIYSKNEK